MLFSSGDQSSQSGKEIEESVDVFLKKRIYKANQKVNGKCVDKLLHVLKGIRNKENLY